MISALEQVKPECVVITARDVTEFGHRDFGSDYARGFGEWINSNYEFERIFPTAQNAGWRLYLARRKG